MVGKTPQEKAQAFVCAELHYDRLRELGVHQEMLEDATHRVGVSWMEVDKDAEALAIVDEVRAQVTRERFRERLLREGSRFGRLCDVLDTLVDLDTREIPGYRDQSFDELLALLRGAKSWNDPAMLLDLVYVLLTDVRHEVLTGTPRK